MSPKIFTPNYPQQFNKTAPVRDANHQNEDDSFRDACVDGLFGQFKPVENDFSANENRELGNGSISFTRKLETISRELDKARKFRYVIGTLALASMGLGLMSRMILNIAIVEMVQSKSSHKHSDVVLTTPVYSDDIYIASDEIITTHPEVGPSNSDIEGSTEQLPLSEPDLEHSDPLVRTADQDNKLRFDWSKAEVNALIGSFYIGYAPAILISGGIADRYGSFYPLMLAIIGSGSVNLLTPLIASYSLRGLIASRMVMGIIQGAIMPCNYDIFNKWLTKTETNIFVPLIKVSMPLGSLLGTAMPFIMKFLGYEWPFLFYTGGFLCIVWSLLWFLLSSSSPQASRFVHESELTRIMRKKVTASELATVIDKVRPLDAEKSTVSRAEETKSAPWLLIMRNPSVIALAIVKYTYNIGMDFFYLELAVYLREVHSASIETISMIASSGYLMQFSLITFIGVAAKNLVTRRAFGLSVTKWRKIFQGTSNFGMALVYFLFPLLGDSLPSVTVLIMFIWLFWMLGVGGESLVPYDLSAKYPAVIVAIAHSISIFSGTTVPSLCTLVLGSQADDAAGWNLIFVIVGCLLVGGGLVFVCVLKAKPFLPEERESAPASLHSCKYGCCDSSSGGPIKS